MPMNAGNLPVYGWQMTCEPESKPPYREAHEGMSCSVAHRLLERVHTWSRSALYYKEIDGCQPTILVIHTSLNPLKCL
jgi:hypothetical protein